MPGIPEEPSLPEQILLLALRDRKGTLELRAGMHRYALGGAVLAELALRGSLAIGGERKRLVEPGAPETLPDPVLEECRAAVAGAARRKGATTWVSRFSRIRRLRHRVAEGLCRRGILKSSEEQFLLIFTRKVYPATDPEPERRLIERLREAIEGDGDGLDARTALAVTIAHDAGLLGIHFPWKVRWRRRARIKRIARGEAVAEPDRTVLAAIHKAVADLVRRSRASHAAHGG